MNAAVRTMRSDAQRNRDAIVRAARETYAESGILSPLDAIADRAGVGNATLYRNFPTRDDLLAAVIEDEVLEALRRSESLEHSLPAGPALQEWLQTMAWHLRIWHDLPSCIAGGITDGESPVQDVCARLIARTGVLLSNARREDAVTTSSVSAEDLFELTTAVSWGIDRFGDDEDRARNRVALATAGVFRTP